MAQPGRVQRSGRWGRWFKSSRPDHFASKLYLKFKPVLFKKLQTCIYHLNIIMISSRSCSLTFVSWAALSLTQTSNSSCVGLLVIRKPYDSLLPKRIMAILCRSSIPRTSCGNIGTFVIVREENIEWIFLIYPACSTLLEEQKLQHPP